MPYVPQPSNQTPTQPQYQQPSYGPPPGYPVQPEVVQAPPAHAQPVPMVPAPVPVPQQYQTYAQPPQMPAPTQPAAQPPAPTRPGGVGLFSPVSTEAVRASLDDAQSGDWIAFKEGMNAIRILPPLNGSGMVEPWVAVWVHRLEIPGVKRRHSYVCPKNMMGLPCPGCDEVSHLRSSPNKVDQDLADERDAKADRYALAIDRQQPQPKVRLVRLSWKLYQHLANMLAPPPTHGSSGYAIQPRLFFDLFAGNDVLIVKQGSGLQTTYPSIDLAPPSPLLPGLEHPEHARNHEASARAWALLEQLVAEAPSIRDQQVVLSYESIVQGVQGFLAQVGRTNPMPQGPAPQPWAGLQQPGPMHPQPTAVTAGMGQVNTQQRPY